MKAAADSYLRMQVQAPRSDMAALALSQRQNELDIVPADPLRTDRSPLVAHVRKSQGIPLTFCRRSAAEPSCVGHLSQRGYLLPPRLSLQGAASRLCRGCLSACASPCAKTTVLRA